MTLWSNLALFATYYKTQLLDRLGQIPCLCHPLLLLSFIFLFCFLPYLLSVVAFSSCSGHNACNPELPDPSHFSVTRYVDEYVNYLYSRGFADINESDLTLTICERNNITELLLLMHGSSHEGIMEMGMNGSCCITSRWICLSFIVTRTLSTSMPCGIWFDRTLGVTFWKYLIPYSCFGVLSIFFTRLTLFFIARSTVGLNVGCVQYTSVPDNGWVANHRDVLHSLWSSPERYTMVHSWWCAFEGHCLIFVATTPVFPKCSHYILSGHAMAQLIWRIVT